MYFAPLASKWEIFSEFLEQKNLCIADRAIKLDFIDACFSDQIKVFLDYSSTIQDYASKMKFIKILTCWLLILGPNLCLSQIEKSINILIVEMYGTQSHNAEILMSTFISFLKVIRTFI